MERVSVKIEVDITYELNGEPLEDFKARMGAIPSMIMSVEAIDAGKAKMIQYVGGASIMNLLSVVSGKGKL